MKDSRAYLERKASFAKVLTIYGRKPVLEALSDSSIEPFKLHLAESNKPAPILTNAIDLAKRKNAEVVYHSKEQLSRISKSSKQDQGIALDIHCPSFKNVDDVMKLHQHHIASQQKPEQARPLRLLALCDIHNPQNLGMIIRSACAGNLDGILIPKKGCAALSPLVIKASAGTLFKAPIILCESLFKALKAFKQDGFSVCTLSSHSKESLFEHAAQGPTIYVLGNETEGVSQEIFDLADHKLMIPMQNNVESLNVAVTAALIAFNDGIQRNV